MKRRLVSLAAAASLLLCVATVALWVRSYWRGDTFGYLWDDNGRVGLSVRNTWSMQSNTGELAFGAAALTTLRRPPSGTGWQLESRKAGRGQMLRSFAGSFSTPASGWFLGIGVVFIDERGYALRALALPHWFVVLLTAVAPSLRPLAVLRPPHASRSGLCPTCSYDLRATPERCPECGAVPIAFRGGLLAPSRE